MVQFTRVRSGMQYDDCHCYQWNYTRIHIISGLVAYNYTCSNGDCYVCGTGPFIDPL